ncbi:MAG: YceD family protein [Pseudomonadota bacterium]
MKDPASSEKRADKLPARFKAAEAVARRQQLSGVLPIAMLPRLVEALSAPAELLTVSAQFATHPRSVGRASGRISGLLPLTCQRSLQVFAWPLDISFDWIMVRDEAEEERLLADADPVMLEDEQLKLHEAIEDEVLLALPLIPLAPDAPMPTVPEAASSDQKVKKSQGKTKVPAISDNYQLDDSRPNPFLALKGQLRKD